jgi:chromosome segregation ATPase
MGDDSSSSIVQSLRNEWSLFWESLSGEMPEKKDENSFETGKLKVLSLDDVRRLTRELSQGRKRLNQRLESLTKELELNSAKLESLRMMGSEDEETLRKINELNDQGQRLSHELARLDQTLSAARAHEDDIRRQLTPA